MLVSSLAHGGPCWQRVRDQALSRASSEAQQVHIVPLLDEIVRAQVVQVPRAVVDGEDDGQPVQIDRHSVMGWAWAGAGAGPQPEDCCA